MRTPALLASAAAVLALVGSAASHGQDIDARTMALIHDAATGAPPGGSSADPAALAAARAALQQEKLLLPARPATPEPDIVDLYGRALLLGPRAGAFVPELAVVRNFAIRRDRDATASAIGALFTKAGRPVPQGATMEKLVDAVIGATANEGPEETARRRIEKPGRTIEITDAKRAGLFTIDVTETSPGGQSTRTVLVAERTVRPNAAGTGVEQRAVPLLACTITTAQAAERRTAINGPWTDQQGNTWELSGSSEAVSVVERRGNGKPPLTYTGTYRLGRLEATHRVLAASSVGDELPLWVRQGLVGKTSFVIRLDDCDGSRLDGTWESRHVTYNPAFKSITRIHDPYDLKITLSRGGEGVARGAAEEEAP
jgi:hypothetical protein